jgi:hypothetical protein
MPKGKPDHAKGNLPSPGDMTLRRKNSKTSNSPFIEYEKKNVLKQFDSILKYLEAKGTKEPS